jgi:hypothetical protein
VRAKLQGTQRNGGIAIENAGRGLFRREADGYAITGHNVADPRNAPSWRPALRIWPSRNVITVSVVLESGARDN